MATTSEASPVEMVRLAADPSYILPSLAGSATTTGYE